MNDFLDIFSDVLRIATFQARHPARPLPPHDTNDFASVRTHPAPRLVRSHRNGR